MDKKIIAIDLGGTSAKLALVDRNGSAIEKWSVITDKTNKGQHIVPNLIHSIQEKLSQLNLTSAEILGIGMGSPGNVDFVNKTVIGAYNLNWVEQQAIGEAFQDAFGVPFYIENDANVAAVGEQWMGAGNNEANVVMVTLGTGVGGGVVVDGNLVHGASGAAGEIGHMTIDPTLAIECTCGKTGCLEAVASATGIVNLAIQHMGSSDTPSPLKDILQAEDKLTAKEVFDVAQTGDVFAQEIVDQFAGYLGLACSHLANTLNPSKIVLGGGVSQAGEYLRSKVASQSYRFTFPPIREKTQIVLAQLGNDAGIFGAAKIVLNEESKEESVIS